MYPHIATDIATGMTAVLDTTIINGNQAIGITGLIEHTEHVTTGNLSAETIAATYFNMPAIPRLHATWILSDVTDLQLAALNLPGGQPLLNLDTMTMLGRPVTFTPTMP